MDSKWLNKLYGVKYWEDLGRFDGYFLSILKPFFLLIWIQM